MQGCGVPEERSYLCGGAWDDEKVKNQKMSSIGFYQWVFDMGNGSQNGAEG
jgi:hypothetical protein